MIMRSFILVFFLISISLVVTSRPCGSNEICQKNYDFISQRRERDDYSVHKDSYYMFIDFQTFEDLVTLQGLEYSGVTHDPKEFDPKLGPKDHLHETTSEEKQQALLDSLSTSLGTEDNIVYTLRNNYFVVYGIVDLINYEYTKAFYETTKVVYRFSVQEIIDNMDENELNDIGEVLRFIDQNGLCLNEEYRAGSCSRRYYIESFDKVNKFTNQGLYEALHQSALYVEVGLNPRYFQFHEPGCEHAVHAGYRRPTYAGVLTGIYLPPVGDNDEKYSIDGSYWEMYIRRHGNGYNYARLNCTFMKYNKTTEKWEWNQPFAGLASKVYSVKVPENLPTPLSIPFEQGKKYTNDELNELIEKTIEDSNSSGSNVDTSTLTIPSKHLDCSVQGVHYNVTTINGISNIILDDPRCIIDTTGTLTYVNPTGKIQDSTTASNPTELHYVGLSVRGISFAKDFYPSSFFRIFVEKCHEMKSLVFGSGSLGNTGVVSIKNNTKLITLSFGENAFSSFEDDEFTMMDLPALERLEFHDGSMRNFKTVNVADVDPGDSFYLLGGKAFKGMQKYNEGENVHVDIHTYFSGIENLPFPIQYEDEYVVSVNEDIVIAPISKPENGKCSISPPLLYFDYGLSLDVYTCEVKGKVREAKSGYFTVTVTVDNEVYSDVFFLKAVHRILYYSEYLVFTGNEVDITPLAKPDGIVCSISPDPTDVGLLFNPSTCKLTGVIDEIPPEPLIYTVTDNEAYSTSFILKVHICVPVTYTMKYNNDAIEYWEVWDGDAIVFDSRNAGNKEYLETCLPSNENNQYTVVLKQTSLNFWYYDACLTVKGEYDNVVFKNSIFQITTLKSESFPLSLYMPIHKDESWKLKSGENVLDSDSWFTYSYDDSSWTDYKDGDSHSASGTQYFRKTFVGLDYDYLAAYELSLKYRYGIIVYMNGVEIIRDKIDEDGITKSPYDNTDFHKFIRPAFEVSSGTSILAVEVYYPEGSDYSVDFDAYLAIMASSTNSPFPCFVFPYDVTITGTGNNPNKIFDYDGEYHLQAFYELPSSSPTLMTFSFADVKAFINGVNMWSGQYATQLFNGFTFEGSNNNEDWTSIMSVDNIVYESTYIHKFYYSALSEMYNNYGVIFSRDSTTRKRVYEFQLLTCSAPSPIPYEKTPYTHFIYEYFEVKSFAADVTGCTISPAPPTGLTFDPNTCILSGKASTPSTVDYTVSAMKQDKEISGTFTLVVNGCEGTVVKVLIQYDTNAAEDMLTIRDKFTNEVQLEILKNSGQPNSMQVTYYMCLKNSVYTIIASSTASSGWGGNVQLISLLDNDNTEKIVDLRYRKHYDSPTEFTINTKYSIKTYETWDYMLAPAQVPAEWYSYKQGETGWSSDVVGNLSASSSQIQLFKKKFTVNMSHFNTGYSLNKFTAISISLKYRYGVIIYINGHEMFRKGFAGDVTASTTASTELSSTVFTQITLPITHLTTGENTIAIGLVGKDETQAVEFNCAVRLIHNGKVNRWWNLHDILQFTNVEGYSKKNPLIDVFSMYVDGDNNYRLKSTSTCGDNSITITLMNGVHEWFSSVAIKLGKYQNSKFPRSVVIKAKNEEDPDTEEGWTTLATVTNMEWSIAGEEKRIQLNNSKAYNQYRFENFDGSQENCQWELLAIYLYNDNPELY